MVYHSFQKLHAAPVSQLEIIIIPSIFTAQANTLRIILDTIPSCLSLH